MPSLRSRMEAIGTDLVSADRTGSDYTHAQGLRWGTEKIGARKFLIEAVA